MEKKFCNCNEVCFSYHDLSRNIIHYKCFRVAPKKPCDFLLIEKDNERNWNKEVKKFKNYLLKRKEKDKFTNNNPDIKTNNELTLRDLAKKFLTIPKVATLQQIEMLSKEKFRKNENALQYIERVCLK